MCLTKEKQFYSPSTGLICSGIQR